MSDQSKFTVCHENGTIVTQFKMEHRADKTYPHGGFAKKVKKGFVGSQANPTYAIKIFKENLFNGVTVQELRIAMRGSYCSKLLERTGLSFRLNEKQYFVTDWHEGFPLSQADAETIKKVAIEHRIKVALDLIRQVVILHRKRLIHCDIKPHNVMFTDNTLKLIDLDSVRLQGELPLLSLPHTPAYLSSQLNLELKYNLHYTYFFQEDNRNPNDCL